MLTGGLGRGAARPQPAQHTPGEVLPSTETVTPQRLTGAAARRRHRGLAGARVEAPQGRRGRLAGAPLCPDPMRGGTGRGRAIVNSRYENRAAGVTADRATLLYDSPEVAITKAQQARTARWVVRHQHPGRPDRPRHGHGVRLRQRHRVRAM
ncbi:MAG: hypothetical protein R2734_08315 [Nocardioides sp.]